MNPISFLYSELIYRPLLNGLIFLYTALPYRDLGLAVIALTGIVQLILHPLVVRGLRSQAAASRMQPRLRELQEQYKNNREELAKKTLELHREHGIHPLSPLLPVLLQLPILIGLYQVFWRGISLQDPSLIYGFVPHLVAFNPIAFGFLDLTAKSWMLAIGVGITQFFRAKTSPQPPVIGADKSSDMQRMMQKQTMYVLPVAITIPSMFFPAVVALYLITSNFFAIVQQLWIQRRMHHESNP